MQNLGGAVTPNYQRVMIFVDGTNFLARLEETIGISLDAQRPPASVFPFAKELFNHLPLSSGAIIHRRYWCGSYRGSDPEEGAISNNLHACHFQPVLVKAVEGREKGVDMALAIHLLVNAFNRNYDVGWIIAGDADYIQLVTEAKRYGCILNVAAWRKGVSPNLKLASDEFYDLNESLVQGFLDGRTALKARYETFLKEASVEAENAKARRNSARGGS